MIRPGDRVFFEPGEEHWHGAAPNRFMTHLAMPRWTTTATSRPGATTSPTTSTRPRRPTSRRLLGRRPRPSGRRVRSCRCDPRGQPSSRRGHEKALAGREPEPQTGVRVGRQDELRFDASRAGRGCRSPCRSSSARAHVDLLPVGQPGARRRERQVEPAGAPSRPRRSWTSSSRKVPRYEAFAPAFGGMNIDRS